MQLIEALNTPMTIKEMLSSEDKRDAIIFLMTLYNLMKAVANQYDTLVKNIHFLHQRKRFSSTINGNAGELMAAVTGKWLFSKSSSYRNGDSGPSQNNAVLIAVNVGISQNIT